MIPATIVARPDDDGFEREQDVLPLPRRQERIAPARQTASQEFGPRDVLNALRYHSVLFVVLGSVLAGALGTAAWFLVPAKYTTYAMVYVSRERPQISGRIGLDAGGQSEFATTIKTQANIIKSSATMIAALRDNPKLVQTSMLRSEDDPVAFLEEKIVTEFSDTSQILKVMLTGEDAQEITKIVNAVVDAHVESQTVEGRTGQLRIDRLTKQKDEFDGQYKNLSKRFQDTHGDPNAISDGMSAKQKARLVEFSNWRHERSKCSAAASAARAKLAAAQTKSQQFETAPVPLPADTLQQIDSHPNLKPKFAALAQIDSTINRERGRSTDSGGMVQRLVERRATCVAEIDLTRRQLRAAAENEYRNAWRMKYAAEVEAAQDELRRAEAQEQAAAKQMEEFKDIESVEARPKVGEAGDRQKMLDDLVRYRKKIDEIEETLANLKINLDAPPRVRTWQKAEVPLKREIKKQVALSGFSGILGFAIVGACLTLHETRRKRVYGAGDPLFASQLPLLGCVPEYGAPSLAELTKGQGMDIAGRAFFEAVDKVKTVICRQMSRRRMQVLLVTSAAPDEGKSILAWNLALSLARTDKRTLFVDANLRSPGLHNHFDIASHPGLSEMLRGEKSIQEVVQRTGLDNLWCVAAGVCDESSRQALDKDRLRRFVDRARQDFDYVVFDSCSIQEAVDPMYIAQRADATVLSVRTFASCTTAVERACHRLGQIGTPVLGAVLSDPTVSPSEV